MSVCLPSARICLKSVCNLSVSLPWSLPIWQFCPTKSDANVRLSFRVRATCPLFAVSMSESVLPIVLHAMWVFLVFFVYRHFIYVTLFMSFCLLRLHRCRHRLCRQCFLRSIRLPSAALSSFSGKSDLSLFIKICTFCTFCTFVPPKCNSANSAMSFALQLPQKFHVTNLTNLTILIILLNLVNLVNLVISFIQIDENKTQSKWKC